MVPARVSRPPQNHHARLKRAVLIHRSFAWAWELDNPRLMRTQSKKGLADQELDTDDRTLSDTSDLDPQDVDKAREQGGLEGGGVRGKHWGGGGMESLGLRHPARPHQDPGCDR